MISKTIHYRYCKTRNVKKTLQQLLTEGYFKFDNFKLANNRKQILSSLSDEFMLINSLSLKQNNEYLFGQLVYVEPGKSQPILNIDNKSQTFTMRAFTPNQLEEQLTEAEIENDKKTKSKTKKSQELRKEFTDSILYFLVHGNHIVILQSKALMAKDLERYLIWFCSESGQFTSKSELYLELKPPKETIEKMQQGNAKRLSIGSSLTPRYEKKSKEKNYEQLISKMGIGLEILRQYFIKNKKSKNLIDSLDESNIEVKLEISYKRKTTEKGQQLLDSIATSLRHLDEDEVEIDLTNGVTINGDELRLSKKIGIKYTKSNLIDEVNLFEKMKNWFCEKILSEDVEL